MHFRLDPSPQIRMDEWSETEDVKLRRLSELLSAQWQTISDLFNGSRSAMDCHLRHMFLLENPQHRTNNEPKTGEKKLFLNRSTPRIKIDLGFDKHVWISFSCLFPRVY
ncbi:hypothetical protein ACE6H2_012966 [Prunus campanulata]